MTPPSISNPATDLRVQSEAQSEETTLQPDLAISVRNLSKMYSLYADPRDRLKQSLWYALPKFLRGKPREFYREFWALRDISFEIKRGETVGLIGRNGSGKSTLLQIIAGTLTPTYGQAQINGRVAALLELGSGFNPDFTGRENVYLNGSILGLSQEEIDDIFDRIAAFADIGQFIDQPVKLYSSGMYVRLAFAVQTFVPKEIFIVDEALAVGDEAFQRKCMAALERFQDDGGTVLLVSHDTQTIVRQCERCLLLSEGELVVDEASKPVTDLYQKLMYSEPEQVPQIIAALRQQGLNQVLSSVGQARNGLKKETQEDKNQQPLDSLWSTNDQQPEGVTGCAAQEELSHDQPIAWFDPNMPQPHEVSYGNGHAKIFEYGMYNEQEQPVNVLIAGQRYKWVYKVRFEQEADKANFGMMLKTVDGLDVAGISSIRERVYFDKIKAGSIVEISILIKLNVAPGTYFLNVGVDGQVNGQYTYLHRRVDVCMIRVIPRDSCEPYGIAYLEPQFQYKYLNYDES